MTITWLLTHLFFLGTKVCFGVMIGYCPQRSRDPVRWVGDKGAFPPPPGTEMPTEADANRWDAPREGAGAIDPPPGEGGLVGTMLGAIPTCMHTHTHTKNNELPYRRKISLGNFRRAKISPIQATCTFALYSNSYVNTVKVTWSFVYMYM